MDDMYMKPEYPHDHHVCLDDAMATAKAVCAKRGTRLTDMRRRVLELIWSGHQAVKAYDLLEMLSAPDRKVRPPTVYRALQFLLENGLIHRIESLNAYVGCTVPQSHHISQFLICNRCATVIEMAGEDIASIVSREAESHGFQIDNQTVEVHGICAPCMDVQH